ncbi:FAD-dependent oxidoreductase [Wenyingzhuangia sp. IMCC45533]
MNLEKINHYKSHYTLCPKCKGHGKKSRGLSKKAKINYQKQIEAFLKNNGTGKEPTPPKAHLYPCIYCSGSGLIFHQETQNIPVNNHLPHIAIIGGGIGGFALAIACTHRGIPFTLYEKDKTFDARSQGYGLTLQQASKAIQSLGLFSLEEGVISSRHVVHNTHGEIVGEWGNRKWIKENHQKSPKRTNIHIARQSLRLKLLEQVNTNSNIKWGHQLVDIDTSLRDKVHLKFNNGETIVEQQADILVGADGIRSTVRKLIVDDAKTPLNYLGCIVILGICPLAAIDVQDSDLLDSQTVFQTANGKERIYVMPYTNDSVMWQLSFPMQEEDAKKLSKQGGEYLKKKACEVANWHAPIPQILLATEASLVTGYPVYDRALLNATQLAENHFATLIGDAAHPMSPFKGQGANQAILDALSLARTVYKQCDTHAEWQQEGIKKSVLNIFETEMLQRSAIKVEDSAKAAQFLHSKNVLFKGDKPRK